MLIFQYQLHYKAAFRSLYPIELLFLFDLWHQQLNFKKY